MLEHGDAAQPTRKQFVEEILVALRAAGCTGEVNYDEAKGTLTLDAQRGINVERLYADLAKAGPERRAEALVKVVKMLMHPPTLPVTWAEARARVLPTVKRRMAVVAEATLRSLGQGPPPTIMAEISPHLVFELGYPHELGTLTVPAQTLQDWGVGPDEAFHAAGRNLAALSEKTWRGSPEVPGVHASGWRDGFDTSRMILPRVFGGLPIRGQPVVLSPTPSMLLVTGSEDADGLFQLGLFAQRMFQKSGLVHISRAHRMNPDGESWEAWIPPKGSAAHEPLRLLEAMEEVRDYAEHAALVRQAHAGKGDLPQLPRLEVLQSAMGAEVMTVTTWRTGRPVALPKADAIVLQRGSEVLGIVAWDDLERAFPGILNALPGYPSRHLAATFPEDWQLGMLDLKPWKGPSG